MTGDTLANIATGIVILCFILLLALIPYFIGHNVGYRDGQIDALNGKLYYKLERQADSEFRWVECPQVCDYKKEREQ